MPRGRERVRPAVKGVLRFATAADRLAAIAAVRQAGDPQSVGEALDVRQLDDDGRPMWVMLERHTGQGIVDVLRDRLRTVLAASLDGSRVQVHACGHDENPPAPCSVVAEWRKIAGQIVRVV